MVAIEELGKLTIELNQNGYKSELLIEPVKKRLTLRCSMKAEDIAALARKVLPEKELKPSTSTKVRPF